MAKRRSLGRQKIKIEKIENKNHLQVTFSKRRLGLFKKASELSTLCGVEIAIIIFSPAGKVFSFGHPHVEPIIYRFLTCNPPPKLNTLHHIQTHLGASLGELNKKLNHILDELENAQRMGATLDFMIKANRRQFWWESFMELLDVHELEKVKYSMEDLKYNVTQQASMVMTIPGNSCSIIFPIVSNNVDGTSIFDMYEPKVTSHFMMPYSSTIVSHQVKNLEHEKLMF